MKALPLVALGLWFALSLVLPAGAQLTLPQIQSSPDYPCRQPPGAEKARAPDGHPVVATVQESDHQRGILGLATTEGRYSLAAPPAEIRDLQAGDQLLVCLEGDNIDGEDRLADAGR